MLGENSHATLIDFNAPGLLDAWKSANYTKCNVGASIAMNSIYKAIQSSGGRLTKIKKAIVHVLSNNHCLLSKQRLVEKLQDEKIMPNRSTIYRELKFLTTNNIIKKNSIYEVDYYEMPKDHHHHLICMRCNSINSVQVGNHLERQQKKIAQQNKFHSMNHSLEFYGYCHKCQA